MQTVPLEGARVIDVGTGSGVLAIAAARLGAADVVAIDVDPDATACAVENVAENDVDARVRVITGDSRDVRERDFDLLVANLTGSLLRASSERLLRAVRAGGHLILSGFMLHEEDEVAGAFTPPARMALRDQEDEWGVLVLRT
jgi:ribosomal protein L11 methyltransferase